MERRGKISNCLEAIDEDQRKVLKDLHESFREQVNSIVHQLLQHFLSDDIKERFTNWSREDAPDEDARSWKELEENVKAALSRRFLEIVDQWEEENKVFSTTRIFLMEQFQNYLNNVEFKLQNVQTEAADDDSNNPNKVAVIKQASFWEKAIWNVQTEAADDDSNNPNKVAVIKQASFWEEVICNVLNIPPGVIGPIVGQIAGQIFYPRGRPVIKEKLCERNLLAQVSKDVLTDSVLKRNLKPLVEDKLKDVKLYLDGMEARLPELIEADRRLYIKQLSERSARHASVFREVREHRCQLALFGLSEVCAVQIHGKELEWKEEASSCLGRGAFGAVYQGTMRRDGEVTTVALKVWNVALDAASAEGIMDEIANLR